MYIPLILRLVLPTNHTCGSGEVEVSAYIPYFTALGINETELRVGECNGTVMGENLIFSGECSPSVQVRLHIMLY